MLMQHSDCTFGAQGVYLGSAVALLREDGIGVLTQFAQLRMTQALHLEPAGRASAVTYLQVLLSVGWGIWLFGEQPSFFTLIGAVLVLGGTLIATGALPLPARWVTFWEAPVAIDPPASGSDPHADADHDR